MGEVIEGGEERAADPKVKPALIGDITGSPVIFSDVFAGGGTYNGVIGLLFAVNVSNITAEGQLYNEPAMCARLRIDYPTAVNLRDFLNMQIALLTTPEEKAN